MSPNSTIADVRIYARQWLVCTVFREGNPKWSWTFSHGELNISGVPEGLVTREDRATHWLQWLFDAPEAAQQNFHIAEDGTFIDWPDLGRRISVGELLSHSSLQGFSHRWNTRKLRHDASREELIDCWTDTDKAQLFDLRADGSCANRSLHKGGSGGDAPWKFWWTIEGPRQFQVHQKYNEPHALKDTRLAEELGIPPVHGVCTTYEIMRFDGKVLELLETADNGFVVNGPMPTWWKKSKPPRAWQELRTP